MSAVASAWADQISDRSSTSSCRQFLLWPSIVPLRPPRLRGEMLRRPFQTRTRILRAPSLLLFFVLSVLKRTFTPSSTRTRQANAFCSFIDFIRVYPSRTLFAEKFHLTLYYVVVDSHAG